MVRKTVTVLCWIESNHRGQIERNQKSIRVLPISPSSNFFPDLWIPDYLGGLGCLFFCFLESDSLGILHRFVLLTNAQEMKKHIQKPQHIFPLLPDQSALQQEAKLHLISFTLLCLKHQAEVGFLVPHNSISHPVDQIETILLFLRTKSHDPPANHVQRLCSLPKNLPFWSTAHLLHPWNGAQQLPPVMCAPL